MSTKIGMIWMSNSASITEASGARSRGRFVLFAFFNLAWLYLPSVTGQTVTGPGFDPQQQAASAAKSLNRIDKAAGFVPASADEVLGVVRDIQKAIRDKDVFAFEKAFDQIAYVDRVLNGVSIPPIERAQFEAGMIAKSTFTALAIDVIQHNAEFMFLRLVRRGNETRALFRMIPVKRNAREGAVIKYKELVVRKGVGKSARVVDCSTTADGVYLSQFSHLLAVGALVANPDPGSRPTGVDKEVLRSGSGLMAITRGLSAGNLSAALQAAEKLPSSLGNDRRMLALKCSIAKRLNGPRYKDAVLEFARVYPRDSEADLYLLDLYVEQPNDQELFKVVDRLIVAYQDPYLNYFKVAGLLRQSRTNEALASIDAARNAAPHRSEVSVASIGVMMKLKNHAATAKAIEATESRFGDRVLDLSIFPEFREFADSPEGQACLARRLGFD